MCTLSFSPTRNGLLLAMNRDESLGREVAYVPQIATLKTTRAVYPRETTGGTWIAVNDHGLLFALLNKNGGSNVRRRSRGDVIPNLISSRDLAEVEDRLRFIETSGMLPFTLIAFDANACSIRQMTWDGEGIAMESIPWTARHWFSSSLSDLDAAAVRGRTCAIFREHFVMNADTLRELHRSHSPGPGPFSICVHRPEVGSVSYSEIEIARERVAFSYAAGPPCARGLLYTVQLHLVDRHSPAA